MATKSFEGTTDEKLQQIADFAAEAHNKLYDLELRLAAHQVAIGTLRTAIEAVGILTPGTWQEALETAARHARGLSHSQPDDDAETTRKFAGFLDELVATVAEGTSRFEVIKGGAD